MREIFVASTGRARRSKWCGEVPTQQSQAFVCSKHVLSDEARWPISERCRSNRLILPQQPAGSEKKKKKNWGILRSVLLSLHAESVKVSILCEDRCVQVWVQT